MCIAGYFPKFSFKYVYKNRKVRFLKVHFVQYFKYFSSLLLLLHVLVVLHVTEANFYTYIHATTNLVVKKRINYLIESEKQSLQKIE